MNFKTASPFIAALAIVAVAYLGLKVSLAQLAAIKAASYQAGYAKAQAEHANALSAALVTQQQTLQAEFTRQLNTANAANAAISAEKAELVERANALREEIDYVTTYYRAGRTAEPEPLPACIFTTGFVGVYNRAIGAEPSTATPMPAAGTAQRTAAAASTAATIGSSADALQPSGIGQANILQHLTGYGARCLAIEAQLNGLIDYLEHEQRRSTDGT